MAGVGRLVRWDWEWEWDGGPAGTLALQDFPSSRHKALARAATYH